MRVKVSQEQFDLIVKDPAFKYGFDELQNRLNREIVSKHTGISITELTDNLGIELVIFEPPSLFG